MICRQIRSAARLASVAVRVNIQCWTPKRRVSSSPTQAESSVGSIVVIPLPAWRATASATTGGEWPGIAPVSPRQRSTYVWPSTSVIRAPLASAPNTGKPPAQRIIQGIGTPPTSECSERS